MYPKAYLDYLYYFHAERDYFECHEVLELEWKKQPVELRQSYWVTLIQIAVALYHERRGNTKGASILYNRLIKRIPADKAPLTELSIDSTRLLLDLKLRLNQLDEPFLDYDLPLTDEHLIQLCRNRAGDKWKSPSSLNDADLVHKHIHRHHKTSQTEKEE